MTLDRVVIILQFCIECLLFASDHWSLAWLMLAWPAVLVAPAVAAAQTRRNIPTILAYAMWLTIAVLGETAGVGMAAGRGWADNAPTLVMAAFVGSLAGGVIGLRFGYQVGDALQARDERLPSG